MAEQMTNTATSLDDLNEVLNAIRRLLAEDEAAKSGSRSRSDVINEDSAEFLARRHGGNAALARQMVHTAKEHAQALRAVRGYADWPTQKGEPVTDTKVMGVDSAQPEAAMALASEKPVSGTSSAPFTAQPIGHQDDAQPLQRPRNDLARTLSQSFATANIVLEREGEDVVVDLGIGKNGQPQPDDAITPLRLDTASRIAAPEDLVNRFSAAAPLTQAELATEFEAMLEEDDFAESFDGKGCVRVEAVSSEAPQALNAMEPSVPAALSEEPADELPPPPRRLAFLRPSAWAFRTYVPETVPVSVSLSDQAAPDGPVDEVVASPLTRDMDDTPRMEQAIAAPSEPYASSDFDAALQEGQREEAVQPASCEMVAPLGNSNHSGSGQSANDISGEDDEAIRDLLRELIREELQGELGERFSRNLRALVRREIAAAIDAELSRL